MTKNRLALIIANSDFDDPKRCRSLLLYYSDHGTRDDFGDLTQDLHSPSAALSVMH